MNHIIGDYQNQQLAATQQGLDQQLLNQGAANHQWTNANLSGGTVTISGTSGIFGGVFPGQTITTTPYNQTPNAVPYMPYNLDAQLKEMAAVIQELVKEMGKMRRELAKLSLDRGCGQKSVEDIMRHMDVYVS